MDLVKFSHNLRMEMTRANMRVNELASQANVSTSMMSRYRMGNRKPSLDTLLRIKNALGCSLDDLI
jgi:transcriptional regulator with XRE-family HTH domain